jgi:hypothetical protein
MRRLLALAALLVTGACTNEIDQSTRPINLSGVYNLVSYRGEPLPVVVRNDSVKKEILSGQFTIDADKLWSETLRVRTTFKGSSSIEFVLSAGSWSSVREIAYMSFYDRVNNYAFSGLAAGGSVVMTTVTGEQLIYRR